ncbi:MAG TPA: hypothetical protein PKU77_10880 [Ferruginibacter sp.]|nr:hypothetical protein [Ferruginibacter sp.]
MMEYLPLILIALGILLIIISTVFMLQNKQLKNHRKAFWFFIFLSLPVLGWFLYQSSADYKKMYRRLH